MSTKLRVVGDGHSRNTRIMVGDEQVKGVTRIEITGAVNEPIKAVLHVRDVELDTAILEAVVVRPRRRWRRKGRK